MLSNNKKIFIQLLNENVVIDTFILYQLLKRLTTPFNKWKAYDLDIIDERGNILKPRSSLKSSKEKEAFTLVDLFVLNLKKILEMFPFGRNVLASYAAALFLLKEEKNCVKYIDEITLYEDFVDFFGSINKNDYMRDRISEIFEEAAKKRKFTQHQAKEIGDKLKVDWDKVDLEQFRMGLEVETEHDDGSETDVVDNDLTLGKIALAHLKELPDYYTRLKKVEEDVAANSSGSGAIAGTVGEPIVRRKHRKTFKKFY